MHDKFAPTFCGEELLAEEHHLNIRHDSLKSYMSLAGF
jgi:hypothetical protein